MKLSHHSKRRQEELLKEAIIGPDAETPGETAQESTSQPTRSRSELHVYMTRNANLDYLPNTSHDEGTSGEELLPSRWSRAMPLGHFFIANCCRRA